ncbi:thioesterase family protein [Amycolatopsis cynarae]|uniref:Thioesterase family protein n=1 Tax=Amycolatopsis cynarae TaxID=2995223 RepID=A0ABY7AV53_9PSEU|nr:acyl-CoA thioesterase domain-containing protein [Amycolatopsis sp. HUAS 11-8]WAL63560.1 thioesterase family protein [Amycolatopsis sp. HUAS 11-8]
MSSSVDAAPSEAPGLLPLLDVLDLEPVELDIYRSRRAGEPGFRLFGGEVCAQALVAAERTTAPECRPHSLHAYFLRPGDTGVKVVFRVDRLQEGRTFRRRRVTAIQHGEPILCLEASFTTDRSGTDHQVSAPVAPAPEDCEPFLWRFPAGWPLQPGDVFDVRPATTETRAHRRLLEDLWFRPLGEDTEGRVSPAAVLTYFSDLTFVSALLRPTGRTDVDHMTSLDHVLWFHNEVRLDDWLYFTKNSPAVGTLRGLAEGRIFHRDGTIIATVAQEGLIHAKRES